jgi:phage shock protein E
MKAILNTLSVLFITLTLSNCTVNAQQEQTNLNAANFEAALKQPNVVLVDVRTPEEYNSGHIKGAQNIDIYAPDFAERMSKLPKDATILMYCRSGGRSGSALSFMKEAGYPNIAHLSGGIGAWMSAGKPVE